MRLAVLALASILASASPAAAADANKTVEFAKGADSATIKGSIKGYDGINYLLGAQAGQTLRVSMSASNNACYFNVIAPGADSAMHMGEVAGNTFEGVLAADGQYRVNVYLMRSAARRNESCKHTISFAITGTAASTRSAPRTPTADEQACLLAVTQQTQNGDVTLLSSEASEAATEVIVGVGPQRARWRCLVSDGVVSEVMSLTDEGAL